MHLVSEWKKVGKRKEKGMIKKEWFIKLEELSEYLNISTPTHPSKIKSFFIDNLLFLVLWQYQSLENQSSQLFSICVN